MIGWIVASALYIGGFALTFVVLVDHAGQHPSRWRWWFWVGVLVVTAMWPALIIYAATIYPIIQWRRS